MTERERFIRLFRGEKIDRMPIYYFGTWKETKELWQKEGVYVPDVNVDWGPQLDGMDEDWEPGMWNCHGMATMSLIVPGEDVVVEDCEDYKIVKYATGAVIKHYKRSSSIDQTLVPGLTATRESWERYRSYLDPHDPRRHPADLAERVREMAARTRVTTFWGGSLYGLLREFMGVENFSLAMYDEPELVKEMIDYMAYFYIELFRPFVKDCNFEFVYIFEDCCGANGPLFSPEKYRELFDDAYRKLIRFYKEECGIPFVLLDSDGYCDPLIPCWLESGVDILFPVEVGTWNQTPEKIRNKFGKNVAMMGGVDKFKIKLPENELRQYLMTLRPEAERGRFLPLPDHRIPPDVTLEEMKRYIRVFGEVFDFR